MALSEENPRLYNPASDIIKKVMRYPSTLPDVLSELQEKPVVVYKTNIEYVEGAVRYFEERNVRDERPIKYALQDLLISLKEIYYSDRNFICTMIYSVEDYVLTLEKCIEQIEQRQNVQVCDDCMLQISEAIRRSDDQSIRYDLEDLRDVLKKIQEQQIFDVKQPEYE